MHDNIKRWHEQAKLKIIHVHDVTDHDGRIKVIVTTSHFGRLTMKPYNFSLLEWTEIVERGWIE